MSPRLPKWAEPFYVNRVRYKMAYGSRGSSKSWTYALMILMLCRRQKLRVLCTREIQVSIKASVHQLLVDLIVRFGWLDEWKVTGQNLTHKKTGSYIFFAGLKNNPESVKSTEGVDIVYIEEAQTISELSIRMLLPTVRKPGSEIWMAMNPRFADDYCYKRFVTNAHTMENLLSTKVNWQDNPFFPAILEEERLYDKEFDADMYNHTWEGHLRPFGERPLFDQSTLERLTGDRFGKTSIYGLDLSWSGDNALVGISASPSGHELFIHNSKLRSKVPLNRLSEWITPIEETIVVDSARPEVIDMLRNEHDYTVRGSIKGAGSVAKGFDKLAKFRKIYFAPGTDDVLDEFSKIGFNDKDEITGKRDFADATRYALERIGGGYSTIRRGLL